jgi:hypothetical protein
MSEARHGGDHRGGAPQRRKRKQELLALYGDGESCMCVLKGPLCQGRLTFGTLQQDRIVPGLGYRMEFAGRRMESQYLGNLQPACGPCNKDKFSRPDRYPQGLVPPTG